MKARVAPLAVGLHIGYRFVRICLAYESPGNASLTFKPVTWPAHSDPEWYDLFRGVLPNAYEVATGEVGYGALDHAGLSASSRFDKGFFQRLLYDGTEGEEAKHVWTRFLRAMRNCPRLRAKEPAIVALSFDSIELTSAVNERMPWLRSEDQTAVLEGQLENLGRTLGLREFKIVPPAQTVGCCVLSETGFQPGDVIADVRGSLTRIWGVKDPSRGTIVPLYSSSGIKHYVQSLRDNGRLCDSSIRGLLEVLHNIRQSSDSIADSQIETWLRQHLLPDLLAALERFGARRLWIGGEGAYLLRALRPSGHANVEVEWMPHTLDFPACGAATVAHHLRKMEI